MALVVNDMVKMEWDKSLFLLTQKKTFIVAGKEYVTSTGKKICMFFNCDSAFVWADDAGTPNEDLWSGKELISWLKKEYGGAFPVQYDSFIPVINYGQHEVNMSLIEKYGLQEHVADIEARLKDLAPYGVETEVIPGQAR